MHAVVDGQKYTIEMAHLKSIKVKIGQVVKVVVTEVDEKGRVNASIKDFVTGIELFRSKNVLSNTTSAVKKVFSLSSETSKEFIKSPCFRYSNEFFL